MKKCLTLALCLAAVGTMSAQKEVVDKVAKMSGKQAQLTEARTLIKEAMANPETANDARTYYIAGKVEFDAFNNAMKAAMVNPEDPAANPSDMGRDLISGYEYFLKALPLDQQPNEKGQVKPKVTKDIINKLAGHHNDYFSAGASFFNTKEYYPEAYNSFMIFAELPSLPEAGGKIPAVAPEQLATAYFNAGLSAYSGNQVDKSALAFRKAREAGYPEPEAYIYEIACWQNMAQNDSTKVTAAQDAIFEIAQAGYKQFGTAQPLFLNNIINSLVNRDKSDEALALLTAELQNTPDNAGLYGLRGFLYDRTGKDDLSEADYRKAASMADVDGETLVNAAKKLYRIGTEKYNLLEGNAPETQTARQTIKTDYFLAAQDMVNRARSLNANLPGIDALESSLQYALETFF